MLMMGFEEMELIMADPTNSWVRSTRFFDIFCDKISQGDPLLHTLST